MYILITYIYIKKQTNRKHDSVHLSTQRNNHKNCDNDRIKPINKTIMKRTEARNEINKIPEEIREKYRIGLDDCDVNIHQPSYIHVSFKKELSVHTNDVTWTIENEKLIVAIWIGVEFMHVTVK